MNTHPTLRGSAPRRAAAACAAGVIILALAGLTSWWFGHRDWLAFGQDYVPMPPSTALLMLLLGFAAFLRARLPPNRTFRLVEAVCVLAVLGACVLYWLEFLFQPGSPIGMGLSRTTETVGGIPVGRMSPLTAGCLVAAAAALLCGRVTASHWEPLRSLGGWLALAVFTVSGIVVAGYLAGTPFLYGGSTIPMALLTALAFALVSVATLLCARIDAWPLRMFLRPHAETAHGPGHSVEWPLLVLFLVLAAGIPVVALQYLNRQQAQARLAAYAQLETIARLKVGQIVQWRKERLADANLIRFTPYVARRALDAMAQPESPGTRRMFTGWLDPLLWGGTYEGAMLLDGELNVRLVHPAGASSMMADSVRRPAEEALRTKAIVVTDLHRIAENGSVHLNLLVPLVVRREGTNDNVPAAGLVPLPADRSAGLLVLQINAHEFLFPLIQTWPTPSPTGESLLVRRDGDDVLFLNELRHQHATAMRLRRPLNAAQLPAARGLRGEQGVQEGVDYRGVRVVAAVRPVPETPWVIVAKVDEAELYAPMREDALGIVGLALALLLIAALGVTVYWRQRNERFLQVQLTAERERRVLAERFEHLMKHASDAILLADEQNRILEANDYALALYGYSLAELLAMRLPELVPPWEQGDFVRQAEKLAATGHAVFEALHQRKDGTVLPVEVSSRLVEIDGSRWRLGIIRDITQRKRTEAALRESERRYQVLAETSPAGVFRTDSAGQTTYVNARWCELAGLSVVEALGEGWLRAIHPEDREALFLGWKEANRVHGTCQADYRLLRPDGRVTWVLGRTIPEQDAAGQCVGYVGTITDINERKRAEEALQTAHSQQKLIGDVLRVSLEDVPLEQILAKALDLMLAIPELALQRKGAIFLVESGTETLVMKVQRGLAESVRAACARVPFGMCLCGRAAVSGQVEFCNHLDERHEIHYAGMQPHGHYCMPMQSKGKAIGVIALYVEEGCTRKEGVEQFLAAVAAALSGVIGRRQAEEQIRAQAELLDLTQEAIWVQDMNHCVQYWNRGCELLIGWTAAEALGRPMRELLKPDPADFDRALMLIMNEGRWSGELAILSKDGRKVDVMSHGTLVRDEQNQPQSILLINTDMTEQKKLEAQFLRAQRLESLGRLAAGIAHDVNNILSPILMGTVLLRDDLPSDASRRLVDIIANSAQNGAAIARQLLTFARGTPGQNLPLTPSRLVHEIVKIAQGTFPKSIVLRNESCQDPWTIMGDPTQLHQVLLNLCVNACDAMPGGGTLTLSGENLMLDDCYARLNPEAKAGPYVVLRVSDTGTGMAADIVDKIFDPFFTTKGPETGTGLGLATTQGIVKSHDGFIQVESQVGRGSRFSVYLPAQPAAESVALATAEQDLPRGHGEWVLVVDDEQNVRDVISMLLERCGYHVLTANSGPEAVDLFAMHQSKIQMVLTDLMMPVMDGVATVRVLRGLNPKVRIITFSGAADEARLAEIGGMSVQACLQKPFTAQKLLVTLEQVLGGNQTQDGHP